VKKIFIPTDFTPESLELVEYAILNHPDTQLDIILLAGFRQPEKRWDNFHLNLGGEIRRQLNSPFKTSKNRLLLEYKNNIARISIELFTGVNSYAFQNFLERHGVEDALIPNREILHYRSKKWFDTTRFLKENVKNVIEVPIERAEKVSQWRFSLASLFNL
jgi:hypothetical protein